MPANYYRDKKVKEEARVFCNTKSLYPIHCKHFEPSIEELGAATFSEYVRYTVLRQCQEGYNSDGDGDGEEQEPRQRQRQRLLDNSNNKKNNNKNKNNKHGTRSTNSNNEGTSKRYRANTPKNTYDYGLAKITLPEGYSSLEGIAGDQTGRGREWQPGTPLGDMVLPSPMTQIVHGIGGVYEFTFLDNDPMTVSEYREKADQYMESQVGAVGAKASAAAVAVAVAAAGKTTDHQHQHQHQHNHNHNNQYSIETLERKFWKRLGPTMQSSMYGADMDGTLFGKNDDCDWNLSKLQSCLQLLLMDQEDTQQDNNNDNNNDNNDNNNNKFDGIPGVTTPYLYFGMWASVFCAHTEDMNLFSINYLHAGAPKVWYAVAEGEDSRRFEHLMASNYVHAKKDCPEYLRHKRSLVSPAVLKKAGIPFTSTVQYPGDAIVTFPGSYHSGFNAGFNVAEATNFATPEWIPYGRTARVCNCRPDSVRMDVTKFEALLLRYEREVLQTRRVSWKDWVKRVKKKRLEEEASNASYGSDPKKAKKNHPNTASSHSSHNNHNNSNSNSHNNSNHNSNSNSNHNSTTGNKHKKAKDFWVEVMKSSLYTKSKPKSKKSRKHKRPEETETWHLAKPTNRKSLRPLDRVLCIIPAVVDRTNGRTNGTSNSTTNDKNSGSSGNGLSGSTHTQQEESEECFAGYVYERLNDDARIRLDGMGKKEDIWMPVSSPKLFLDGGKWEEDNDFKMPAKHYWKEEEFSHK